MLIVNGAPTTAQATSVSARRIGPLTAISSPAASGGLPTNAFARANAARSAAPPTATPRLRDRFIDIGHEGVRFGAWHKRPVRTIAAVGETFAHKSASAQRLQKRLRQRQDRQSPLFRDGDDRPGDALVAARLIVKGAMGLQV